MTADTSRVPSADAALARYYRFHSRIYDATRWSFLFGRQGILRSILRAGQSPRRILEVGCGTGRNLLQLCLHFPDAEITGLDLSSEMLDIARAKTRRFGSRVQFLNESYHRPVNPVTGAYDLILFSYALSMFNPGFESAIDASHADLAPDGHVAVVDFYDTRFPWFERWMGVNHVRMKGHLMPLLQAKFEPEMDQIYSAYGGAWRYFLFVGRRISSTARSLGNIASSEYSPQVSSAR